MIHPNDEQSLIRLLGTSDIPKEVLDECAMRTRMYHADGNSGPLRTLALIDMLRFLGKKPPAPVIPKSAVDWRMYPQDGTVRVEARFFGAWQPGVFLGFVQGGTLAVRLDGDAMIKECNASIVRLAEYVTTEDLAHKEEAQASEEEKPDARVALLEQPKKADEEVEDVEPPKDFAALKEGDLVYAEYEGEIHEAKYVSQSEEGVTVVLDGETEPRTLDAELVAFS
jgi:hypothetical protein